MILKTEWIPQNFRTFSFFFYFLGQQDHKLWTQHGDKTIIWADIANKV